MDVPAPEDEDSSGAVDYVPLAVAFRKQETVAQVRRASAAGTKR